ncbi:MAG TPA: hypothetical protein VF460_12100 [Burkholderiales bacterium]
MPRRKAQSGVSRFELMVCVMVFGVLLAVFIEKGLYYQEYAEKTAMEMTVANIRTGLRYRIADLMLANRMSEIPTLADENPMDWLAEKPKNYQGERDSAPATPLEGMWYFDKKSRELIYTVNNRQHFSPSAYRDFTVRYRAMRVRGTDGQAAAETWIAFVGTSDYRWLQ